MMKTLSENRRARFDHDILETYEAGIELLGQEVKSVRAGRLNLGGSFAIIRGGEAWLLNAQIPAWQPKNAPPDYDPARTRRLLFHRSEIRALTGKLHEKGLVLIPLRAFDRKNVIKLDIALGKSRKGPDKRQVIKKREVEREIRRAAS